MDIAVSFVEMTRDKKRKDMGQEACRIWLRMFLKKVIKPEYYIMVCQNLADLKMDLESRLKFGKIIDDILDLCEKGDTSIHTAKKIDAIFQLYFSNMFRKRMINSYTGENKLETVKLKSNMIIIFPRQKSAGWKVSPDNKVETEYRLDIEEGCIFAREKLQLNRKELLVSLGKLSVIRWETLCFIKGGAMKGKNAGTVTVACLEQSETVEALVASVVGTDAGILEPGYYSKEKLSKIHIIYTLL